MECVIARFLILLQNICLNAFSRWFLEVEGYFIFSVILCVPHSAKKLLLFDNLCYPISGLLSITTIYIVDRSVYV